MAWGQGFSAGAFSAKELPTCQAHALSVAIEERQAKLALETANLLTQRRLGDDQPLGGAREMELLGDRDEIAQMPRFHCRRHRRHLSVGNGVGAGRVGSMALKRMDNVGIVVEDLAATIEFFRELGLELEGRATVEGDWAERVTGLHPMRVEMAMMRTPDGHSRLEISRFLAPAPMADHRKAPVNALGYLRVMFAVDDIDETLARLRKHGAELVSSEVVRYEDAYRLCYIRGPEGLLIGLAEELG